MPALLWESLLWVPALKQAELNHYLSLVSPADPQFLQIVMGLAGAKAAGIIKDNNQCLQASQAVMATVFAYTQDPLQGQMTQQVGDLACNDAVPPDAAAAANQQNGVVPLASAPPVVNVPQGLPPIPPIPPQPGFAGLYYPTYPIAVCQGPAFPGVPGSPWLVQVILSNLVVLNATPSPQGIFWQPVARMTMDGTGHFLMVAPNAPPWFTGITADGRVWRVNAYTGQGGPIGTCT